jgi:hypothetical protein
LNVSSRSPLSHSIPRVDPLSHLSLQCVQQMLQLGQRWSRPVASGRNAQVIDQSRFTL